MGQSLNSEFVFLHGLLLKSMEGGATLFDLDRINDAECLVLLLAPTALASQGQLSAPLLSIVACACGLSLLR